jgi:hypothetical protein
MVSGAEDWRYIYTADDERFRMYRVGGGGSIWTLRGLDAKVLREYQAHAGWSAFKDYVYRGSALLAEADSTVLGSAVRHFHLDHLGTVRAITNTAGQRIAYHVWSEFIMCTSPRSSAIRCRLHQVYLCWSARLLLGSIGTSSNR